MSLTDGGTSTRDQAGVVEMAGLAPLERVEDTLTDRVFHVIQTAIVTKELPAGSRVSEASLAKQLGVSKSPVREALLRLSHMGFVVSVNRRFQVVSPSRRDLEEAYDLRATLEAAAAERAAHSGSDELKAAVREAAQASLDRASAGDIEGFRAADRDFHRGVALATGTKLLASTAQEAYIRTWALRERDVPSVEDVIQCAHEHLGVADAIDAGDGTAAGSRLRAHIDRVADMVLAAWPGSGRLRQV